MHLQTLDRFLRLGLPLALLAILLTVFTVGWMTQPDRFHDGYAPVQPIPFSHKVHAGDNRIPCEFCHSAVSASRHATIPAVEACFKCHLVTKTDSEDIRRLKEIADSGAPLPWKRVYDQPDHVYFDHRPHVSLGISCTECHGPVEEMDLLRQDMNLRMGACLKCHRGERDWRTQVPPARSYMVQVPNGHPTGPTSCTACHR